MSEEPAPVGDLLIGIGCLLIVAALIAWAAGWVG